MAGWCHSKFQTEVGELMSVVRVAFFRNENGKAVLAKEFVMRDADGNYPSWRPIDRDGV